MRKKNNSIETMTDSTTNFISKIEQKFIGLEFILVWNRKDLSNKRKKQKKRERVKKKTTKKIKTLIKV